LVSRGLLVSLTMIFLSCFNIASAEPKGLSATIGVGNNFGSPGTIRIGWNAWEYGMLTGRVYGASKLFFFSDSFYTSLGVGFVESTLGVTAGIGAWYEMFWGIALRAEVSANVNVAAVLLEQGILGISVDF
jgi:hypothetical protein